MTSPSLSLGPVLDLIERFQRVNKLATTDFPGNALALDEVLMVLSKCDIPALRAIAEQHAAQLRGISRLEDLSDMYADELVAAANFLAPRREQEGE